MYTTPQNESQLIHNMEHGGIIVWYDPDLVDAEGVSDLANYVNTQVSAGISGRYKFILSPWSGEVELETPSRHCVAPVARARRRRHRRNRRVRTRALWTVTRAQRRPRTARLTPEPR